jgi:uncharacterized protein YeaO (DUF488 family)
MYQIGLKRAYDAPHSEDGKRILVERLWPRGVSRDKAALDHWTKDIAPSAELRNICATSPVTFIYGAKDELRNNATVLRAYVIAN